MTQVLTTKVDLEMTLKMNPSSEAHRLLTSLNPNSFIGNMFYENAMDRLKWDAQ